MKKTLTTLFSLFSVALALFAGPLKAGALTDYGENKSVDWLIRAQSYTPPTTTAHWALGTNACSDSGTPTEPSGNGYTRAAYAASLANWSGTQGAGTTAASTGTGGTISNNSSVPYPTSTGAWASGANLVSVWLMDAASSGNALICITLTTPIAVTAAGFTLAFPAAALSFQIDN